jgi:4-amino-4-deoxy-L-arabinose transferase-like glycosyltransferase
MYAFFFLFFYGVSKRAINKTGAAIITFFVLLTPEMIAFSSLSMTNVIHAVFASLAIIYLTMWFRDRKKYDLFLSAFLLAINMFCRTEGIVFVGAAFAVLFVDMWINKHYKQYAFFAVIALSTVVIWNVFMKINGISAESIAIIKPFWDSEKMTIIWKYMVSLFTSTQYYGVTFIVLLIGFFANLWFLIKKRNNIYLLSMILIAMILYMTLLYHIDYKWDTIENVLSYSAKRFMFCFIPLLWFYVASNESVLWLLNKTELFLSVKKD